MVFRALTSALVLLASACGPGKEAELMKQREQYCDAAAGGVLYIDLENQLENTEYKVVCDPTGATTTTFSPAGIDHCGSQPVCRLFVGFVANDQNLCGSPPTQGCYFVCEVRALVADFDAHYGGDKKFPICASQWWKKLAIPL